MATLTFIFWTMTDWFGENLGTLVHVIFMSFTVFKNLKLSFLEDNMPEHAIDIFIKTAYKRF